MNDYEKRYHKLAEVRIVGDDAHPILTGNAVVYNSLSEDLGCFREIIAPGAFEESLKTADVRCLIDHLPHLLLGRNTSGTLRLIDGPKALRMECDLDDTSYAVDLRKTVKRSDRSGMSFGFTNVKDRWDEDEIGIVRTVLKGKIFDVSAVTYPAYTDTTLAMRSLEAWKQAKPVMSRPAIDHRDEARRMRLRMNQSLFKPPV